MDPWTSPRPRVDCDDLDLAVCTLIARSVARGNVFYFLFFSFAKIRVYCLPRQQEERFFVSLWSESGQ